MNYLLSANNALSPSSVPLILSQEASSAMDAMPSICRYLWFGFFVFGKGGSGGTVTFFLWRDVCAFLQFVDAQFLVGSVLAEIRDKEAILD